MSCVDLPTLRRRLVRAALSLALAHATLACGAEPACRTDLDCDEAMICSEGTCQPLDLAAAIAGVCSVGSDCSSGERCESGRCVPDLDVSSCTRWDDPICPPGQACRPKFDEPCTGEPCSLRLSCQPKVGERPAGRSCTSDEACATGRCHEGVCLRPCANDTHCGPAGFRCVDLSLPEGIVSACQGLDEAGRFDPGLSICLAATECPEGRSCRFFTPTTQGRVVPLCRPTGDGLPALSVCGASADCESAYCTYACSGYFFSPCHRSLCQQPCSVDEDCPEFSVCTGLDNAPREGETGTAIDRGNPYSVEGEILRSCRRPYSSCVDDVDCCPSRDEAGRCYNSFLVDDSFCGLGRVTRGRVSTQCLLASPTKAGPGSACTRAEDCASGLCLEIGGQALCTSLCNPDDDRCATRTMPDTTCRPTDVVFEGTTYALATCR